MAAVETKVPGHFTDNVGNADCDVDWGTDTVVLKDNEISYALGKKGMTRKKLAKSSGYCPTPAPTHFTERASTRSNTAPHPHSAPSSAATRCPVISARDRYLVPSHPRWLVS